MITSTSAKLTTVTTLFLTIATLGASPAAKAQQYLPAANPTIPTQVAQVASPTAYYQSYYYQPQQATEPQYYQAQPAQYAAPSQASGDPYGFTAWLNATRASYGLGPVGFDPNLAGWAAQNNSHQQSRGMGHYVMGPARRQNSAMGDYTSIGSMWMASPAHRAALLDPSIRWIGIAGLGTYWTFNAN